MKVNIRSRKWLWLVIFAVLAIAVIGILAGRSLADQDSIQTAIDAKLDLLQAADAQFKEKTTLEGRDEIRLVYHCARTNMDYQFLEDGSFVEMIMTETNGGYPLDDSLPDLEDGELDQTVLELAERCVSEEKLGDLSIWSHNSFAGHHTYEIVERCGDIPTGTKIGLECAQNGQIYYAIVTYGGVFSRDKDGEIRQIKPIVLTEAQAEQIALQELAGRLQGSGAELPEQAEKVTLMAKEKALFYEVELRTTKSGQENAIYWIRVDTETGEILEVLHG